MCDLSFCCVSSHANPLCPFLITPDLQIESLKREIASALQDRDRVLKELSDVRDKQQQTESAAASAASQEEGGSRRDSLSSAGLAEQEQAGQEMENLRRNMERLQVELAGACIGARRLGFLRKKREGGRGRPRGRGLALGALQNSCLFVCPKGALNAQHF